MSRVIGALSFSLALSVLSAQQPPAGRGAGQQNQPPGRTQSIEERTAYDLWYVENWSLLLDFKIMIRTIPAMFRNNNG